MKKTDLNNSITMASIKPELINIVSSNINSFLKTKNMSQKDLADALDIAPSSLSGYCNGKSSALPPIEFFICMKTKFGIDIDAFLTKYINIDDFNKDDNSDTQKQELQKEYQKYLGVYTVYYLDTGNYKGRDNNSREDSLTYGVLVIFENGSQISASSYEIIAIMGIDTNTEAYKLRESFIKSDNPELLAKELSTGLYSSKLYTGDFEIQDKFIYMSLVHGTSDRALAIFHNPTTNKSKYVGGIGTVNSVSKGREKMPTIQYIAITRDPLTQSLDEIHQNLLLSTPTISAEEFAPKLVSIIKNLYFDSEADFDKSSDLQKLITVRANAELFIKENLEQNLFRYAKVSNRDDDAFYHWIQGKTNDYDD